MKKLKDTIIEKLVITKDSKVKNISSINSEEDFVSKYGLKLIRRNNDLHTYKMSEELADKIFKKFNYNNEKVDNYIKNELNIPDDYQFCCGELANHNKLVFYFEDLNDDIIDCMTFHRNDKTKFIYEPYHINYENYKDMKGKLFNVLDYIIENG